MSADGGTVVSRSHGTQAGHAPSGGPPDVGRSLELVSVLCRAFEEAGIRYCHFKSNEGIELSASGENDLDLLVHRADTQRFDEVVTRLGFKAVDYASAWKFLPGVFHWYALDQPSGRLVHIHAHHQLLVGDDMTKNARLPIEDPYIAAAIDHPPFKIAAPAYEFALLLIRMVLKHCPWDSILMLQGSMSASERRELVQLRAEVDLPQVWETMERHLPMIPAPLWEGMLRAVQPGASLWFRVRTARRLQRALSSCNRRPQPVDTYLKIWRRVRTLFRRKIFRRGPVEKRIRSGGALIAIVGSDGAGKSTAVEDIRRWLGKEITTTSMHMGKPPRSVSTRAVRKSIKAAAKVRRSPNPTGAQIRTSLQGSDDGSPVSLRDSTRLIWEVFTARDRYRAYRRARRRATNGALVVCDRFPLPQITLMDGAVTAHLSDPSRRGRFVAALAARERRYYERIASPDVLIVLRVDPDLAVQRKQGVERESLVRPRAEEIWSIDWSGSPALVVEANQPKDDVLREIRSLVWSRL